VGALDELMRPPDNPATPYNQGVRNVLHELLVQPVKQAGQALQGRMTEGEARNFALDAAMGLIPMGRAAKAVKAAKSLPMDEASRMARAAEQGYGPDLYHGTASEVTEFKPNRAGAVYLTDEPRIADIYADIRYGEGKKKWGHPTNAHPNVMPVRAKMENPLTVSDLNSKGEMGYFTDNLATALGKNLDDMPHIGNAYRDLINEARDRGHDMIVMKDFSDLGGPQTQYMSLLPKQIRSKFAAFDPANKDSGNLLGSLLGGGITGGALLQLMNGEQ
jgi:hypothetical protein